jgi:hypothetical protein
MVISPLAQQGAKNNANSTATPTLFIHPRLFVMFPLQLLVHACQRICEIRF